MIARKSFGLHRAWWESNFDFDIPKMRSVFAGERQTLVPPVAREEIPIHPGVMVPKNLETAGEISDGVLLSGMTSPAYARFAGEHVRPGAERSGRKFEDIEMGALLLISVSENEYQAREAVKPIIATLISLLSSQPESLMFTTPGLSPDSIRPFGEALAKGELAVKPDDRLDDRHVHYRGWSGAMPRAVGRAGRGWRAASGRIRDSGHRARRDARRSSSPT